MNEELHTAGLGNWRVFNLARNGARLTPMLYVYARIAVLKPEIVVFGDRIDYYRGDNAGAGDLRPHHYAYLDQIFGADAATAAIWSSYRETLIKHGLAPPPKVKPPRDLSNRFQRRERTTLSDVLVRLLLIMRHARVAEGPPLPIKFVPGYRTWQMAHTFKNFDPELDYFQGLRLISELQKRHGGKLFVYFSPHYDNRKNLDYLGALDNVLGNYLVTNGITFASHVAMGLMPISETYDGSHQTLYGNRIIAKTLLHDLIEHQLVR
jgi:hypothetical protein